MVLCDAASHGRHFGHVGRFTLTSFLLTIGMPPEKVAEVFKTSSDYNARLTRYQVEHIAGSTGVRNTIHSSQLLDIADPRCMLQF